MPKPTNKYDRQHLLNLQRIQAQIEAIYREATREAAAIGVSITDFNPDKPFAFGDYPLTLRRVESLMLRFKAAVELCVVNGVESEWTLANDKNNELANRVFGRNIGRLTQEQYRRYYSTNEAARDAFLQRKVGGLTLSDRVWRYTGEFKGEIEMGLDLGIRGGLSADEMTRDLRQYLKHPDMLFRRVRDEHGILHLSKRAAQFHPGRGVYRSSYMNARRLAATEGNIAYRTSDHERWQQMDFVVGIEIHLSNNHTCKGRDGKPRPFHDICDELAGRYPKDFKFTGWHPHCRCYATSILKTDEEIARDTQKILNGEKTDGESVNRVNDVPQGFKDWLANNEQRVKYHSTVPNFLRDNPRFLPNGFIDNIGTLRRDGDAGVITDMKDALIKLKDPTYITEREVRTMISDFAQANPTLFYGGLKAVKVTKAKNTDFYMANSRGYFRKNGAYDVNGGNTLKIADIDFPVGSGETFNPLHEVKSAMRAISEKRSLTFQEEYSLESLWHEFRHASAKGWVDVRKKTMERSMVMETVNQFCARRSYGQFVRAIGGKPSNVKEIVESGYGYHGWVKNFNKILRRCNISQSSANVYLRDRIITTPYEDITEEVVELLVNRGGLKRQTAEDLLKGLRLSDAAFDKLLTGA